MGLLNIFKSVLGKQDTIASAISLLKGKINVKNLATIFTTYLLQSKLAKTSSDAKSQAASFAQQVASSINLNECSGINDVISKLTASDKEGTTDLAQQLKKAVTLIQSIGS